MLETTNPADVDRRNRRSDHIPRALAFQCAHVRDSLNLSSLVVADDAGGDWVGAGDKVLCRLLAKSAPELAIGTSESAGYRFKVMKSIMSDLTPDQLTTYSIRVPDRDRYLFVAAIGKNTKRTDGVIHTVGGVRRILNYDPAQGAALSLSFAADPEATLQRVLLNSYREWEKETHAEPRLRSVFGWIDDSVYKPALDALMKPVTDVLQLCGLSLDSLWRGFRWTSVEVADDNGNYTRQLSATMREARAKVPVGTLYLDLFHRHDVYEIPFCPVVRIRWNA